MLPRSHQVPVRSQRGRELARLVVRSAEGDRAAFALLFEATHHAIYGYVLGIVRDPAQAEEITQDAFLRVWLESRSYDPARAGALRWIQLFAHRCSVDSIRKAESLRRLDLHDFRSNAVVVPDEVAGAMEQRSEIATLHSALSTLTDLERQAIELAFFEGLTHLQTAQTLRVPPGTAKGRIRAGLIRLRRTLAALDDEPTGDVGRLPATRAEGRGAV